MTVQVIPPRSGTAFALRRGQRLTVIDPEGEQVSDMVAFALDDHEEALSSGRTLDYASRLFLTTGDPVRVSGKATQFLRNPIRFESA